MINYKKTELIAECNEKYFEAYATTLDVADFVPMEHIEKIHKWILKSMKKEQRKIDKENRRYQRSLRKLIKSGQVVDTTSLEYVLSDIDKTYLIPSSKPTINLVINSDSVAVAENEVAPNSEQANAGGENNVQEENN